MDVLLIFRKTEKQHRNQLETVLSHLKSGKLHGSPKKCCFRIEETEFIGLFVGRSGIKENRENREMVQAWPKTDNVH